MASADLPTADCVPAIGSTSAVEDNASGAVLVDKLSSVVFRSVTFNGNAALDPTLGVGGGAVYAVNAASIVATNCSFVNNSAAYLGAGLAFVVNDTFPWDEDGLYPDEVDYTTMPF